MSRPQSKTLIVALVLVGAGAVIWLVLFMRSGSSSMTDSAQARANASCLLQNIRMELNGSEESVAQVLERSGWLDCELESEGARYLLNPDRSAFLDVEQSVPLIVRRDADDARHIVRKTRGSDEFSSWAEVEEAVPWLADAITLDVDRAGGA